MSTNHATQSAKTSANLKTLSAVLFLVFASAFVAHAQSLGETTNYLVTNLNRVSYQGTLNGVFTTSFTQCVALPDGQGLTITLGSNQSTTNTVMVIYSHLNIDWLKPSPILSQPGNPTAYHLGIGFSSDTHTRFILWSDDPDLLTRIRKALLHAAQLCRSKDPFAS
jgi:hypothetical protein